MGRSGRFGKYGDVKRHERLREGRFQDKGVLATDVWEKPGTQNHAAGVSPSVTIRTAGPRDLPFVCDLSRRVFRRYGPYEEILPRWFISGLSMVVVAETQRGPVGFAMMARVADQGAGRETAEIMAIAVDPSRQGQGVGRALMETLERKARQASIRRLILHTAIDNLTAKALFSRLGFIAVEARQGFYPEGQHALMMIKILSPCDSVG
jgi:ribosomal protein S18 acetylase RimI-like enzyme